MRQQLAQLMTDQTNLTNLINAYMQRGSLVPADMTQQLNEISQQITTLTLQLNTLHGGQATPPMPQRRRAAVSRPYSRAARCRRAGRERGQL